MIRARILGRERVIANMGKKQLQMESETSKWVNGSTKVLFRKVSDNISLTCHSLADLARMGHPYARAHLNNPHSPYYQVHMQSGAMRGRLKQEVVSDSREIRGGVGYTQEDEQSLKAPGSKYSYLRCIIFGTEHMTDRDFLNGSLSEIKDEVQHRLIEQMTRAARRRV